MMDHPLNITDHIDSWTISLRAERKSPATVSNYLCGLRIFLKWCENTGRPPVLDRAVVKEFTASLLADGAEASTAVSRQHAVRRFAAWAVEEGLLNEDPLLGLKLPKIDVKVTESLTEDELKRLIKVCQGSDYRDRRDEAIVRLMTETGMRAGELLGLQLVDVDLPRGLAVITRGKGGRGRIVPFGPQTARALDRYLRVRRGHTLAATDELWLGERGRTFGYTGLQRSLLKRAELAGIKNFHLHLLRHTAASRWLAAGGSEQGLMAVAGWRSRQMLDRYTRATASERAAAEARSLNLGDL